MKKISLIISLSFLVLFLLASNVNSANDSSKNKDNNDGNGLSSNWVDYSSDNYGNIYLCKMLNIKKDGENYIVQALVKKVLSDKGREEEIQSLKKLGFPTEEYEKLSDLRSVNEIDCNKKNSRVLSINYLDMDGKSLLSHDYDNSVWGSVTPDTTGDKLQREVCK